jgi:acetyl esterase/lipase
MASTYSVTTEDIEFAKPGGKPLLARMYRPQGPGPFPAMVEVHGGAWVMNDRTSNAAIDQPVAESGCVVMAVDFRMPPEVKYPASVADINLAVRWLKAHARDYATRPELVGGLGTSSGAHQLLLSMMRPKDPRYAAHAHPAATDAKLAFAVLCWPIADPLARYRMVTRKGNTRLVEAHDAYWSGEAEMTEGNPQLILERGEPVELPPAIVLQGTADDNVTPDMADKFAAAYRGAGGRVTLEKFDDQPHTFIPKDPTTPASLNALESIKAFIRTQVG